MRNHWLRAVVGFVWGLLLFLGVAWPLKIVLDRVVGLLVRRDARAVDVVTTRCQRGQGDLSVDIGRGLGLCGLAGSK